MENPWRAVGLDRRVSYPFSSLHRCLESAEKRVDGDLRLDLRDADFLGDRDTISCLTTSTLLSAKLLQGLYLLSRRAVNPVDFPGRQALQTPLKNQVSQLYPAGCRTGTGTRSPLRIVQSQ